MSKQEYYRGGRNQQKRDEFGGFEAFKKNSSSSSSSNSTSRWNESVKNQWNDPQRYMNEISKNYERNSDHHDVFDKYKTKTISDRENDYTSKWRNNQLSPERIDPFASNKKSSSNSDTKSSSSSSSSTANNQSNKRTYNEIYEENKIERERRNLLYQLKRANNNTTNNQQLSSSSSSSSNQSNNKNDNQRNNNSEQNDNNSNNINNVNVGINFENSGILLLQTNVVNQKGTILKWQSPPECKNSNQKWLMIENDKKDPILLFKQKAWLLGRDQDISDVNLLNPSCSNQHAVICFRKINDTSNRFTTNNSNIKEDIKPFIIDLKSTNGTFINGERIDDSRYYELRNSDILTFGQSSREFIIILNESDE